jgi:hypothetical protein
MGIFTELADGPREFSELAGRLGLHPRAARDFLDALVALGFLHRSQGHYCNAPDADLFLDRNKPSYIGGILEMANARLFGFWNHLTEALRTGQPQNESKNDASASPFTALYADPARLKGFLAAMSGISHGANLAIARQVPWTKYQTYADLGTAQGDLAVQIALANPHLRGMGLDLPEVGPVFEEYAEANGVSDRLRFQPRGFLPRTAVRRRRAHNGAHSA